ncbi:MAG: type I-C CRISPR-associated protein Cas7/Csd2 [Oscillospiraceae bacterium]|nr:type I-C CRISPR-associated protein Cas7/Csd2 [Oscillospiraceae bacterium]
MNKKMLTKKIDFAIIIGVRNANPNGDPLNGNRPRTDYDGYGEMTDVCLKRKIRNRLLDMGESILIQSDDYKKDEYPDIKTRYEAEMGKPNKDDKTSEKAKIACEKWFDVRAFGAVLAWKDGKSPNQVSVSIPVRGPVSIQSAFSKEPIDITHLKITKSTSGDIGGEIKGSDTMGDKHRVDKGIYVIYGSINKQLSEKTGFSDDDAKTLKEAMLKMFENDESAARPAGSMEVIKLIWWTHTEKTLSSAKVHRSLHVNADGTYTLDDIGIKTEEIDGE